MTAFAGELRPLFPAGSIPAFPFPLLLEQPTPPQSLNPESITNRYPGAGLVIFNDDSILITFNNKPLAWIQPGNYTTQRHDRQFYDVAYVRSCSTISQLHRTGTMLDSESFDTEAEALIFIDELLAEEVRS